MLLIQIKNDRGVSLVELLITMMIVSIGIFSVLTVFPSSWRLTSQSDRIGQASEIMHRELETAQLAILNSCSPVAAGTINTPTVYSSGRPGPQQGDANYSVARTTTALVGNTWSVTVQVTWPNNATGVIGSVVAGRDDYFAEGGCL